MSDTPKTDAVVESLHKGGMTVNQELMDHSRQLERELNNMFRSWPSVPFEAIRAAREALFKEHGPLAYVGDCPKCARLKELDEWLSRPAGPSGGDWRSMQTAPLNGVPILGVVGTKNRQVRIIQFGKTSHVPMYGWCLADQGVEDFDLCTPTAWMPLPEFPPPASEGKS